jgi:hypothetical protein
MGVTSKNHIQGGSKIFISYKGITKGPFNRGVPMLNGMAQYMFMRLAYIALSREKGIISVEYKL